MHVELIDRLRCPETHADSWLVAHAEESEGRAIIRGTLGCPVCAAEYRIDEGEVWFGTDEPPIIAAEVIPDEADAERVTALLNMDGSGGLYIIGGLRAAVLLALTPAESERILLLSSPLGLKADGTLRGAGARIPVATGCVRGVVLDETTARCAPDAARALSVGGRLVAPQGTRLPHGLRELASDCDEWVAEKEAGFDPGALVIPRRAAPRTGNR